MVDVRRVKLPGVGILHTFVAANGGKVGVISHRSGTSDLISFANADEDDVGEKVSLRLSEDEAHTLAELLGGTQITEAVHGLEQIPGLSIDWFTVDHNDHIAGLSLGSMPQQGLVGCSVVAVVRGDTSNAGPGADFKVFPGDTLVLAGPREKVAKALRFYRSGEVDEKQPQPVGDL